MPNVLYIEKVIAALKKREVQAREDSQASVIVGYTSGYALYVHENMEQRLKGTARPSGLGVYWGPTGGPKYLEEPARIFAEDIAEIIVSAMQKGVRLLQALFLGGLRLQRESQVRVPVEYGFLRASAFTRKEDR